MSLSQYSSANRPWDDFSLAGGGIDLQARPLFTQIDVSSVITVEADPLDTRFLNLEGRDSTNNRIIDLVDLSEAPFNTINIYNRFLRAEVDVTHPSYTVTIKVGTSTIATIPPKELLVELLFLGSFSENVEIDRYEKFFVRNDGSSNIEGPYVALTSDPELVHSIGLDPIPNSGSSVTNRKTAPSGVTFVGLSQPLPVPGGLLSPGRSIGVWARQRLPAERAGYAAPFTIQVLGGS